MNKVYGVFHLYDEDGGFGDAIRQKELICIFDSEEKANAFKEKYQNPHEYSKPYDMLYCGELRVEELPTTYNEQDFWWRDNEDTEEEEWHRQVMEEMTTQQLMEQEPELFEV